jgi:hypothetical protein
MTASELALKVHKMGLFCPTNVPMQINDHIWLCRDHFEWRDSWRRKSEERRPTYRLEDFGEVIVPVILRFREIIEDRKKRIANMQMRNEAMQMLLDELTHHERREPAEAVRIPVR